MDTAWRIEVHGIVQGVGFGRSRTGSRPGRGRHSGEASGTRAAPRHLIDR
ncbi:hypothetical protein ABGB18_02230 [Nonomuraea sp. B12E4]